MKAKARVRALAMAGAACALLGACQALIGINDDEGIPPPPDAATADSADGAFSDVYDSGCFPRKPPRPPLDATVEAGTIVTFAFTKVILEPTDTPLPTIGYDLDDRCTDDSLLPRHEPSCQGMPAPDAVDGVDNAFLSLIGGFGLAASDPSDPKASSFNKAIRTGKGGTLLAISGYDPNAQNIAQLDVGIGALTGIEDGGAPTLDGGDRWLFDPATILNGLPFPMAVGDGYVANDILVTRPTTLMFAIGGFKLPLESAVLSAHIVHEPNGVLRLAGGTIAGRVVPGKLIEAAGPTLIDNMPLCQSPVFSAALQDVVCKGRDIPLSPRNDGKDKPCDAVSFGIGFEAISAELSEAGQPPPPSPCDATPTCD